VYSIKEQLVGATGCSMPQQRLFFMGRELKDEMLLGQSAIAIEEGSMLQLFMRQAETAPPPPYEDNRQVQ